MKKLESYKDLYFHLLEATKKAQQCEPHERREILVTALEEAKAAEEKMEKLTN